MAMAKGQDIAGCVDNNMGRIGHRPYWVLNLSVAIRAAHQVGAALFLAVYLLPTAAPLPSIYLALVMVSGGGLLFTEWLRHRQLAREVSGLVTIVKVILLGAAYHGFLPAPMAVLAAFIVASLGAHAPKPVRHKLLY